MIPAILSDLSTNPQNLWLLFAAGGFTIIYIAVIRPLRRSKDPMAKSPARFPLAQQRAVERQMETLLVELSEMARQLTAQLDTRAVKLELLIREADEKIAALNGGSSAPGPSAPPPSPPVEIESPPPEEDSRHAAVYELADEGLGAQQIAQKLGRPSGEIELILALRPRRAAASGGG
jgi:hypothetical protein